ncbi:hypothetical protein [Rathayibacter sp. VKM Ac-2759]|uniref:hypothetical protein n=1 Tax=Rathayibacter sp. VKM Ac-2759 TaxID=2609252 RepID=UPI001423CECA|nr:hypothetical protein [Rathayibacter sp. VKM Ac-2759]
MPEDRRAVVLVATADGHDVAALVASAIRCQADSLSAALLEIAMGDSRASGRDSRRAG